MQKSHFIPIIQIEHAKHVPMFPLFHLILKLPVQRLSQMMSAFDPIHISIILKIELPFIYSESLLPNKIWRAKRRSTQ